MERNLHRYIIKRSLRPQLILIGISFVLGLALNPLMLDLQKRIINQAIGHRNFDALLWLCGAFLGAVLLNGALKYVKQNLEGYISETMLRDLRSELYNRILRFPLPHLKNTSTGQLVAMILGEVEDLGGYFGLALSTPAFHGAMLVGTLGYMVYANPWMALVRDGALPDPDRLHPAAPAQGHRDVAGSGADGARPVRPDPGVRGRAPGDLRQRHGRPTSRAGSGTCSSGSSRSG